jgi:MFS family permease
MYHGWKIIGVAFLTNFISVGFIFYSYGVFFKDLAADFGGSRLGIGVGLAVMNVVNGIISPMLGRVADRGHIRGMMFCGAAFLGVGFLLTSRITALWQFYALLALLLGPGAAMIGMIPGSTLVANWFIDRRGMALGIATMGISLSGMIMSFASTLLIESIGWRNSFLVFAVSSVIVVVPAVYYWVIDRPEDIGLLPDGHPHPPGEAPVEPVVPGATGDQMISHPAHLEWTAIFAFRNPNFWAITLTIALNMCANGAMLTHMIPHVTDLGFSPRAAASVLALSAGTGVIGKIFFGWITDHVDKRSALWLSSGLQLVGVVLFFYAERYTWLLWAGGVFGFGMGGLVPLWATLVGSAFGRRVFGRVMGLMSPFMIPIQSLGVPFAGLVYDRTGHYDFAFQVFMGVYLFAIAALYLVRMPAVEPGREARAPGAA